MSAYFLALDIGGTKTSGALFSESCELVDDYVYTAPSQTFKGEEAVYQNTKNVLETVLEHFSLSVNDVRGIGVGSPGPLDSKRGIIIHAPLMGWKNFPIVARLKNDFHTDVLIDNDGNLGAFAEQRCGVAKGLQNVAYMTVSTGCGGGLVIGGKIHHGKHDGAGEVGHVSIDKNGLPCPCGSRGCFELYASGSAMNRIMREDMRKGIRSRVFEFAEYNENAVNGKILDRAAAENDEYALSLFEKEGELLGFGIAHIFNLFDPDVFVLGGGVTKSKRYFHEALMRTLRAYSIQPIDDESVRYSIMNDRVVLFGACYMIREALG